MIYLDNSATTKISDEALKEYNRISEEMYFNPASLHTGGFNAEKEVQISRNKIAKVFNSSPEEIYFTSGGTESDNMAIIGAALNKRRKGNHIITTKTEHHAVLNTCKFLENNGFDISYVNVDFEGKVNPDEIRALITDKTVLVSVMAVNNETGTVQPVSDIKKNIGDITLHCDAVQGFGKLDISKLNADIVSVSSHKIHGPKGVGAIYIKKGVRISPINFGGNQENGLRSGTLNTPAICAFGIAAENAIKNLDKNILHISLLHKKLKEILFNNLDDISVNGDSSENGILNISFNGIRGEVLLHSLAEKGIYISTGSACNSKSTKISYVLDAMGIKRNYAEGAVRISIGATNTEDDIIYAAEEIINAVKILRQFKRR